LLLNTVQVVLVPVLAGLALHHLVPRAVDWVLPLAPPVAVLAIVLICSSIIGSSATAIKESGGLMLAAVGLLHAGGFLLGYLFAWLLGYDKIIRRTVSIEVGMQNSGLGVVLASRNFSDPLTAVPSAVSSVFHSIMGSALAGLWRRQP
jgi:BASS family bile acid:Na+ symporter